MTILAEGTHVITERTLALAVERGLLLPEQAAGLRALAVGASASETQDDEKLRFISGFGDIFVTIGLALFLGAVGYFGETRLGLSGMAVLVAVTSWGLAEFFTRNRRMALPSIVLLITYASMVFVAARIGLTVLAGGGETARSLWTLGNEPLPLVGAGLTTVLGTALHYWRFRVPITLAAGAAALVAAALGLIILIAPGLAESAFTGILLVCGVLVFALAMRFDISDPQRMTKRTDIAFWLHMLAAPLIVHPLVKGFVADPGEPNAGAAWAVLAIFAALGVVAMLIDRRAILVSGLAYAGFAFGALVRDTGLVNSVAPLTMLVLGALVLLLSAGWRTLRHLLLGLLPVGIARQLPNPYPGHLKFESQS
jgi:hypothetical protein